MPSFSPDQTRGAGAGATRMSQEVSKRLVSGL